MFFFSVANIKTWKKNVRFVLRNSKLQVSIDYKKLPAFTKRIIEIANSVFKYCDLRII